MKLLITGASGFIGTDLIKELSKQNEILAIDIIEPQIKNSNIKFLKVDITKSEELSDIKNIDGIIHLAAVSRVSDAVQNPQKTININILGTLNLLELARKNNCWFILGSTIEPPNNLYGLTKQFSNNLTKHYAENFNLKTLVLKFSGIFGSGDNPNKLIPKLIREAMNNQEIKINSPETKFDFIFIEDLIQGIKKAVEFVQSPSENKTYDEIPLASGKLISMKQIAEIIIQKTNSDSELIKGNQPEEIRDFYDYKKAEEVLNWKPEISFEEGVRRVVESFREN